MKRVKDFFKERYLGYKLIIQHCNIDKDNEYYDLDFYIKDNRVNYYGYATKEDRSYIDFIIGSVGLLEVLDKEIDTKYKEIILEVNK